VRAGEKSPGTARALDAMGLAVLFAILYGATRLAPNMPGTPSILASLGFLLLAGTLMSQLIEVLRVPHLTGYLLAGILAGPHVLHLIDTDSVKALAPVNTLALALIALAGGTELRMDQLRKGIKSLVVSNVVQSVSIIVIIGGTFILARPLLPFTADMTFTGVVAAALLWGIIATSRSPSATLAILAQTRARGPLASFALASVMLSDVVVILMLAGGMMIARPLLEPGSTLSLAAFRALGHEIIGSVSIGTMLGLLLAIYIKVSGRQLMVVIVALGFGATETLHFLQFDPLLAFLVAGFIVQNLSKQGEKFLHAIEEMGGVVYVVFFAIAGADLDIPLLRSLWPVALLLGGVRALVTFGAQRVSAKIAKDTPLLRRWAWTSLVAQAGLTQGLGGVVEREFPGFGTPIRALVIANVAINAIVGPILFKLALDRVKETKAPSASLGDADNLAPAPEEGTT
jgi:Kef-type K+ transport system membrane component KefB